MSGGVARRGQPKALEAQQQSDYVAVAQLSDEEFTAAKAKLLA